MGILRTAASRRAVTAPRTLLLMAMAVTAIASTSCGRDDGHPSIRVLAASSLSDVFADIAADFEAETGVRVELSLGPSSGLREQILAGAPADVFASATVGEIAALDERGLVAGRNVFARNEIVLAVPEGNPGAVTALADLADPELLVGLCDAAVPCGRLGRAVLAAAGVEASIDTNATDVRALRTQLLSGDLDVGLVYATDVRGSDGDLVAVDLPAEARMATDYAVATLTSATDPDAADDFRRYLDGSQARDRLRAAGFEQP